MIVMSYAYFKGNMHIVGMDFEEREECKENEEIIGKVDDHKVVVFKTNIQDSNLYFHIDEYLKHCKKEAFKNAALLLKNSTVNIKECEQNDSKISNHLSFAL